MFAPAVTITRLRLRDVGSEKQISQAARRSGELAVYRPAVRPVAAPPTAREMAGPGAAATRTVEHGDIEPFLLGLLPRRARLAFVAFVGMNAAEAVVQRHLRERFRDVMRRVYNVSMDNPK